MRKIAIITPCMLPVPATKGGAVEVLITKLLDENEIRGELDIDVYSMSSCDTDKYTKSTFITVNKSHLTEITDRVIDKVCRTFKLCSRRTYDNSIVKAFIKRIKEDGIKYDYIICENMMSTALKIMKYKDSLFECPVYFHMHNDIDIYRSPAMTRKLRDYGVRFQAVSRYIKERIWEAASRPDVEVWYNGVDTTVFDYRLCEQKAEIRREIGVPDDSILIQYSGRIIKEKGVSELIEAFNNMCDNTPEIRERVILNVIGMNADSESDYENLVRKLASTNNHINLINRAGENTMARYYAACDIVAVSSLTDEPFGMVALEAIAMGKPVIATRAGGLPEILDESFARFVERDGVIENLEKAMLELVKRDDLSEFETKAYKHFSKCKAFKSSEFFNHLDRITGNYKNISENSIVSVIIPVYNVEFFLDRCVQSALSQTYPYLEIILVDDGSTDLSGKLCDEYIDTDSRIRVVHKENGGLSSARNAGIDVATGEYIFFLDSDDYIMDETIETMLNKAKSRDYGVVSCGIEQVWDIDKMDLNAPFTSPVAGEWDGRSSVLEMQLNNTICSVACNKLYKASLWKKMRFPVGKLHEDEYTTYRILYEAERVAYIPDLFYKYYQRADGISAGTTSDDRDDHLAAFYERFEFFKSCGDVELTEWSLVRYLEYIKYLYRNSQSKERKAELAAKYVEDLKVYRLTKVSAYKKFALILWKYWKY